MVRKTSISYLLYIILVVLVIYQDSPLSSILGAAGYSILTSLSLVLFACKSLLKGSITIRDKVQKNLWLLAVWIGAVSIVAILCWRVLGNSFTVLGENAFFKALKVIMQYAAYPAYLSLLVDALSDLDFKQTFRPIIFTMILLCVICLIENTQIPYAFQNLHNAASFPYWRIRLLTTESSWTTMLILVFTFLSLWYSLEVRSKLTLIITAVCFLIFMSTTGSRTLIISVILFLLLLVVILFREKRVTIRTFIVTCLVLVATVVFIYIYSPQLSSSFATDIESYTSTATRGYTIFLGALIGIIYPFGVGGGISAPLLQQFMLRFIWIFDKLPIKFNLSEIYNYANSTVDTSVTVKSGLLQYNVHWGIIGTILFVRTVSEPVKNFRQGKHYQIIVAAFWTLVILLTFALNFSFEFWLFMAIIVNYSGESDEASTID